jgi:nucleotide-binding universal stress UspA family protein
VTNGHGPAVVVGVDGSADGRAALAWAAREATARGSGLRLVHAWSVPSTDGIVGRHMVDALRAAAEQLVEDEAAHARHLAPDAPVTTRLEYGDPAVAIVQSSDEAELLVVGSRGRSPIAGLVLGSVSRAVVSQATRPVVVVASDATSRGGDASGSAPRPVVVGVDDSPEARTALRWAAAYARERELPLRVVHAFQPRHVAGVFGMAELQPDALWRSDAEAALARVLDDEIGSPDDVEVEALTARDGPAAAVLAVAAGASLVVVGSRGRGRAVSALLGSVSGAVLAGARCPVVVVPAATAADGGLPPGDPVAEGRT